MLDTPSDYKGYQFSKMGVFEVDTNEYKLPGGWIQKEEEHLIIGEDEHIYVTKFLPHCHGEWVGDVVIQTNYIIAIGLHKSRLVRWKETQLQLF